MDRLVGVGGGVGGLRFMEDEWRYEGFEDDEGFGFQDYEDGDDDDDDDLYEEVEDYEQWLKEMKEMKPKCPTRE
jgi:hypothetical protein